MKKLIMFTLITTWIFIISCSGENILDTTVPTIVKPAEIIVANEFTEAVTSFAEHNNALYAGTKNLTDGAEVYRFDGTNMIKVFTALNTNYEFVDSMYSFNNRLYIGLYNASDGAAVYRSNTINPADGMANWELVYSNTPDFNSIGAITEYGGNIYIGVSSYDTGGGGPDKAMVLFSATGNSGSFTDTSASWGLYNNKISGFMEYNTFLYVATIKQANNYGDGGELWYYNGAWNARVDDSVGDINGGFGNPNNMGIPSFVSSGGYFYMGVKNAAADGTEMTPDTGCKIWRSNDLSTAGAYEEVVNNGFGDINNISVDSMIVYQGYIYAFTRNHTSGTQMWRSASGNAGSWSMRNTSGFGDANNVSGRAVIVFNGVLYIGLESASVGTTIIQYGAAP